MGDFDELQGHQPAAEEDLTTQPEPEPEPEPEPKPAKPSKKADN
jgi:hypothetical protein